MFSCLDPSKGKDPAVLNHPETRKRIDALIEQPRKNYDKYYGQQSRITVSLYTLFFSILFAPLISKSFTISVLLA